jgi:uncharacterized lipoprotein YddW (UPF0748 family)
VTRIWVIGIGAMLACAALGPGVGAATAPPDVSRWITSSPSDTVSIATVARRDSTHVADYLWVVRTTLLDPASFPDVIARAHEMGARGLLVQIVGRGDSYYDSQILPRAEALGRATPDPFARLLGLAHAAGLEVHAWMNCMLVWSAPQRPRDPFHVARAHPEWIAATTGGRSLARLSARQRNRLRIEGLFLAPARPAVRHFVASVATEIATRYPVDGIHLDYIRQPGVPVGYDSETRARFALEAGVDPLRLGAVPYARRAAVDSAWKAFQREQVTAVVREVRDSLDAITSRSGIAARWPGPVADPEARPHRSIALSAAVLADTLAARNLNAQAWTEWVRSGLIDRAFAMCYAAPVQTVMEQLVAYDTALGIDGRVVPGIAIYNTRPAPAAAKMLGARSLGFPLLAIYSYDALAERPGYWAELKQSLAAPEGKP